MGTTQIVHPIMGLVLWINHLPLYVGLGFGKSFSHVLIGKYVRMETSFSNYINVCW